MKTFTPRERSEVDIRIAQEIKNHQDLMYEAHQKINALNEGVVNLSLVQEKTKADMAKNVQGLLIAFENLKENVDAIHKQVVKILGDIESRIFKVLDEFNELKEEVSISYITKEEFEKIFYNLESKVVSNQHYFTLKNDNLNQNIENFKVKALEDLRNLREEMTPKPPEINKQEIEEKFKVMKVDFDGLVREIALLKKAVAYDQKKFENVYTLIDRLKEGKRCPGE